jgi:centromeric protein E
VKSSFLRFPIEANIPSDCFFFFKKNSLLTLEKVISGLAEPVGQSKRRSQHIPYRDSKLTQILQPSLSGKSRVCVICTMNWTYQSVEDSRSTLRFASRVKKIQTSAGVNEILSDSALMVRYRQQVRARSFLPLTISIHVPFCARVSERG